MVPLPPAARSFSSLGLPIMNVPGGHQQNFICSTFADHSSPALFPANARVSGGHGSGTGLGSDCATGLGTVSDFLGSAGCFAPCFGGEGSSVSAFCTLA